jgi:hypothetical protein
MKENQRKVQNALWQNYLGILVVVSVIEEIIVVLALGILVVIVTLIILIIFVAPGVLVVVFALGVLVRGKAIVGG